MKRTMTRQDFNDMVHACRNYDGYTQYIDDYRQMEQAEEANRCYDKWFMEIAINYDIRVKGVPYSLTNLGETTEKSVADWLTRHNVEIEAQEEKQKRIWTEEEIANYIQTNDEVLYGALKKLYEQQTVDEQEAGHTRHHNNAGFNGVDGPILSSMAEFLIKRGFLSTKQKYIVRKKLVKYNKQLTRLANE